MIHNAAEVGQSVLDLLQSVKKTKCRANQNTTMKISWSMFKCVISTALLGITIIVQEITHVYSWLAVYYRADKCISSSDFLQLIQTPQQVSQTSTEQRITVWSFSASSCVRRVISLLSSWSSNSRAESCEVTSAKTFMAETNIESYNKRASRSSRIQGK